MATDSRTLTVSLVAKSELFARGLNKARGHLAGFRKQFGGVATDIVKHSRTIALAAAGMGAAFIGGTAAIIHQSRNSIDELAKVAQRIGATTEEMQVLQRIADLDGIGIDAMNSNLQRMTKILGEASMGLGGAGKVLEEFGLDAKKLIQLPISEQFAEIAEAISKVPNQAQRAALATALFGRSGVAMLVSLQKGRAVVDDMFAELDGTGELFSAEEAGRVEEMNDAMTRLAGVFSAFGNQLTIQIAPAITYIIELAQAWVTSMGGAGNIISQVMDFAVDSIGQVMDALSHTFAFINDLSDGLVDFAETSEKSASVSSMAFQGFIKVIEYAGRSLHTFKGIINLIAHVVTASARIGIQGIAVLVTGTLDGIMNFIKVIGTQIDKLTAGLAKVGKVAGFDVEGTSIGASVDPYLQKAKKANAQAMEKFKTLFTESAGGPLADSFWNESIDSFYQAFSNVNVSDKASSGLREWWDATKKSISEYEPALKEQADTVSGTVDQLASTIPKMGDMTDGLKSAMEEDKKREKDLLNQDPGAFQAQRRGTYTGFTGGVTAISEGGISTLAARAAANSSNSMTGGDESKGLLQGILTAAQATAQNTRNGQLALAG